MLRIACKNARDPIAIDLFDPAFDGAYKMSRKAYKKNASYYKKTRKSALLFTINYLLIKACIYRGLGRISGF